MSLYSNWDTFPYPGRLPPDPTDLSKIWVPDPPLNIFVDEKIGDVLRKRLGVHFSYLEVDADACADLLRTYGNYSAAYSAKIAISSKMRTTDDRELISGDSFLYRAYVYLGSLLYTYKQPAQPEWLSTKLSETLAHELSHIADRQRLSNDELVRERQMASYRRVGPGVVAGVGASMMAGYVAANLHSPWLGLGIGLAGAGAALRVGRSRSGLEIHNAMVDSNHGLYRRQPDEIRALGVETIYSQDLAKGGPYLIRIVQQDGSLA